MAESAQILIPSEILDAYYPYGVSDQTIIPGGEVNVTFLVTDSQDTKTILQQLSPFYDSRIGEDYEVVAAHLTGKGWEMATALQTVDGTSYLPDSTGRLWRASSYIESTPGREREGDLEASAALGGLLGALHQDLADFDYQPTFSHPYASPPAHQLQALLSKIADSDARELATEMITLSGEDTIDNEPLQVIHDDPRIGNALFRDGKPFTFIDWDAYKIASPLADVGDMLQSTVGEVLIEGAGSCSAKQLYPILEAYYATAKPEINKQVFMERAFAAGRVVALNLGMRHLVDSVEDRYFVWDSSRFNSRLEFNLSCAQKQRQIYKVLSS
jgi:Ser/Thr protein kinase RdoA (MazF antagonist)